VKAKGSLYLIPTVIADDTEETISPSVIDALKKIRHFLAEDVRTARRYLSRLKIYDHMEALEFHVLNKDTSPKDIESLFSPVIEGHHLGVISESGCPGVADPGALAVAYAHEAGIRVVPLVGPSSILLALMASGLNGQQFAFHGYLPVDSAERASTIKRLEKESQQKNQTQIFIETPYRNNQLFSGLTKSLAGTTLLCVAVDLTGKNENICTKSIREWKKESVVWPKLPAVFLFSAS
jgi:16S rRNA (cytidine1402-2'-O)-methyltransferase